MRTGVLVPALKLKQHSTVQLTATTHGYPLMVETPPRVSQGPVGVQPLLTRQRQPPFQRLSSASPHLHHPALPPYAAIVARGLLNPRGHLRRFPSGGAAQFPAPLLAPPHGTTPTRRNPAARAYPNPRGISTARGIPATHVFPRPREFPGFAKASVSSHAAIAVPTLRRPHLRQRPNSGGDRAH